MSNYTGTLPSLRQDIAENLTLLGVGYPAAILAADQREQVADRIEYGEMQQRLDDAEWETENLVANVRAALRGDHDDVETLRKAVEQAIE